MTVNEVQELFCCCCHFFYCLCFLNTSHRPVVSVPNAVNNTKSIELLSNISLRALKSDAFVSIDTHVLQLLIPYKVQIGLSKFQRKFRRNQRIKMERESTLVNLLKESFREEYLRAPESKQYDRSMGTVSLLLGDHLEVFDGLVYHHGIYIGIRDGVMSVLDNSQEIFANGKSIQYRSLTDFIGDRLKFSIIKCRCLGNEEEDEFRLNVVRIASLLEELDYTDLQMYDVIKWNCENFAWMCSTHGSICYSI